MLDLEPQLFSEPKLLPFIQRSSYLETLGTTKKSEKPVFNQEKQCVLYVWGWQDLKRNPSHKSLYHVSMVVRAVQFFSKRLGCRLLVLGCKLPYSGAARSRFDTFHNRETMSSTTVVHKISIGYWSSSRCTRKIPADDSWGKSSFANILPAQYVLSNKSIQFRL